MRVNIFYSVNVRKMGVEEEASKEVMAEIEAFLSSVSIVAKQRGFEVFVDSTIVLHSKPDDTDDDASHIDTF